MPGIVEGHQGIPAIEFHQFNSQLIHEDTRAPLRKHPAFAAENEWRLYGSFAGFIEGAKYPQVQLREGPSYLIPYMVIPFKKDGPLAVEPPVASITIGPTPHPEEAKAALTNYLFDAYMIPRSVKVRLSTAPYRDW